MDAQSVARGFRNKTIKNLFLAAVKAGWDWRLAGNGHVLLTPTNGAPPVALSISVGDSARSTKNATASLRRRGLNV